MRHPWWCFSIVPSILWLSKRCLISVHKYGLGALEWIHFPIWPWIPVNEHTPVHKANPYQPQDCVNCIPESVYIGVHRCSLSCQAISCQWSWRKNPNEEVSNSSYRVVSQIVSQRVFFFTCFRRRDPDILQNLLSQCGADVTHQPGVEPQQLMSFLQIQLQTQMHF